MDDPDSLIVPPSFSGIGKDIYAASDRGNETLNGSIISEIPVNTGVGRSSSLDDNRYFQTAAEKDEMG